MEDGQKSVACLCILSGKGPTYACKNKRRKFNALKRKKPVSKATAAPLDTGLPPNLDVPMLLQQVRKVCCALH